MLKRTQRRETIFDVYNIALGAFLFVSPWLFAYVNEAARLDVWAVGAAITLLSIAAVISYFEWEEWITFLLAAWLIASPWVLGFTHMRSMHVSIAVGVVVLFLSGLELWMVHYDTPEHKRVAGQ